MKIKTGVVYNLSMAEKQTISSKKTEDHLGWYNPFLFEFRKQARMTIGSALASIRSMFFVMSG